MVSAFTLMTLAAVVTSFRWKTERVKKQSCGRFVVQPCSTAALEGYHNAGRTRTALSVLLRFTEEPNAPPFSPPRLREKVTPELLVYMPLTDCMQGQISGCTQLGGVRPRGLEAYNYVARLKCARDEQVCVHGTADITHPNALGPSAASALTRLPERTMRHAAARRGGRQMTSSEIETALRRALPRAHVVMYIHSPTLPPVSLTAGMIVMALFCGRRDPAELGAKAEDADSAVFVCEERA